MTEPNVSFETINAERAKDYLARRDGQRPLSENHVKRLADKMRARVWSETSEPIHFDVDGVLVNGQHRLSAIVASGMAQKMLVVRGVPKDAFAKMDQGKMRSASDTLAVIGANNYVQAAVASRLLISIRNEGRIQRNRFDNSVIEEFYIDHRKDMDEAVFLAQQSRGLVTVGVLGAVLFMTLQASREQTHEFSRALTSGANLGSRSPVLLLREKLIRMKQQGGKRGLHPEEVMPLIVAAWNLFAENKETSRLCPSASLLPKGFHSSGWNKVSA